MATIKKKPTLLLAAITVCVVSLGLLYYFGNVSSPTIDPKVNTPDTYYLSDDVPLPLIDDFIDFLNSEGYKATDDVNASVTIQRSGSKTGISQKINETNTITLFQTLVLAENPTLPPNQNTSLTYTIDPEINYWENITKEAQNITLSGIVVSYESNSTSNRVLLTPIQKVNITSMQTIIQPQLLNFEITEDNFSDTTYPIILAIKISGDQEIIQKGSSEVFTETFLQNRYLSTEPITQDSITTIVKTGTSVAGGPGWQLCERTKGRAEYPIEQVTEVLSSADVTIVSNESSFVEGCTQSAGTTAFCGKPSYLQNLLSIGTDIVSLTGNHMADYGKQAFSDTLSIYRDNNIKYFGGGDSLEEAWKPLVFTDGTTKIAFIGVNLMGPAGVLAGEQTTGVAYYDSAKASQAISIAKEQADIVWVDTHLWPEYGTTPTGDQITVTNELAAAGADIITGVSSHELQGMTFIDDTIVFYGLGNFLFDQMWSQETRQGMVVRFTAFEGKIVAMELLPTILYDYCQPRFATGIEKQQLLDYFYVISNV